MMQQSLYTEETERAYARRHDPSTSHEAAASIPSPAINAQKQRILTLLAVRGAMTDFEIKSHYEKSWPVPTEQSLRSRRSELEAKGLVKFTGDYGRSPTGRRAQKWNITQAGRQAI